METSISQQIKKIVEDNLDKILAGRLKRTLKEDNSFVTEGDMLCQNLVID